MTGELRSHYGKPADWNTQLYVDGYYRSNNIEFHKKVAGFNEGGDYQSRYEIRDRVMRELATENEIFKSVRDYNAFEKRRQRAMSPQVVCTVCFNRAERKKDYYKHHPEAIPYPWAVRCPMQVPMYIGDTKKFQHTRRCVLDRGHTDTCTTFPKFIDEHPECKFEEGHNGICQKIGRVPSARESRKRKLEPSSSSLSSN
jgi:hypothetical protein